MIHNMILQELSSEREVGTIITVVGVGGAGGNAVNHMYEMGIHGVEFMVCNTDRQDLAKSPVPNKIQLGDGLGAGGDPDVGREKATESAEEIRLFLERTNTKMLFLTAGMGGGTGTGASPVIAKIARDMNILIVGIVSLASQIEGHKRYGQGLDGLKSLKECVDSIIVIRNDNIIEKYGNLSFKEAYKKADEVLCNSAKGIAEIITIEGADHNIDFADVSRAMRESGRAHMSVVRYKVGESADEVVSKALSSPLLDQNSIVGAKNLLINFSAADNRAVILSDAMSILMELQSEARRSDDESLAPAEAKLGVSVKKELEEGEIELVMVATGFGSPDDLGAKPTGAGKLPKLSQKPQKRNKETVSQQVNQIEGVVEQVVTLGEAVNRYENIDAILGRPAYKARKVKFKNPTLVTQKRRGGTLSNVSSVQSRINGGGAPSQPAAESQELFADDSDNGKL